MKLFPNFSIFYTAGERGSLMLVTMWVFETSLFHFALFCWWGASCTPNVFWCQWENDLWGLICSELYCDHMHYTINIWSKYEKISRKLEFGTGCRGALYEFQLSISVSYDWKWIFLEAETKASFLFLTNSKKHFTEM